MKHDVARHPVSEARTAREIVASSLAKQSSHTLQDTVLLGIIGVVFAGDFEDSGEGIGEGVYAMADALCDLLKGVRSHWLGTPGTFMTNVLVDQKNSNVLSVLREVLESLLDLRGLGLGIDD